jgi:hypothetical protein
MRRPLSLVCDNGNVALLVADGLATAWRRRRESRSRSLRSACVRAGERYFDEAHGRCAARGGGHVSRNPPARIAALCGREYAGPCSTATDAPVWLLGGTVGAYMRAVRPLSCDWPAGDLLVMHSDGLKSSWSLSGYPGLQARHPAIVGAVLHRDFLRGADDATIVVLRRGE